VEVVHGAKATLFSERYACPKCGLSLPELEPRQFSFNSPFGACPECSGLGVRREVSPDLVLGDSSLSILEGVIVPWGEPSGYVRKVILPSLARAFQFDLDSPWKDLPAAVKKVVLSGAPGKKLTFHYDSERWHGEYESGWDGVLKHVERRYRETASDSVREQLEEYMVEQPCPACGSTAGASGMSSISRSRRFSHSSRASHSEPTGGPASTGRSPGRSSRR
jgi:excinuclease ABC subunit A